MKTPFEKLKLDINQIFPDNLLERKNYNKGIYLLKNFMILFVIYYLLVYFNVDCNNIYITILSVITSLFVQYFLISWVFRYFLNSNIYTVLFLDSFGMTNISKIIRKF